MSALGGLAFALLVWVAIALVLLVFGYVVYALVADLRART